MQKVTGKVNQATGKNRILRAWDAVLAVKAEKVALWDAQKRALRTFAEIDGEARRFQEGFPWNRRICAIAVGNDPALPALLLAAFRSGYVPVIAPEAPDEVLLALGVTLRVHADGGFQVLDEDVPSLPEACEFLKLTSGTTGAPRAIQFSSEQLVADCVNVCTTMGITDTDLNYGAIPLGHSYGFSNLVTPLLCFGVSMVLTDDRLPRALVDGLACTGATVFPGTPALFHAMASLPGAELPEVLRVCISAGAPLTLRTADEFFRQFGRKIHTFYGSSECGGIAYDRSGAPPLDAGFVGEAMENVLIKAEANGRIAVRSDAVALGYWPPGPDEALRDGVFRPGDLARRTESGWLLEGRVTDFINVDGRKFLPQELETVLLGIPGIQAATVFAVPSRLRGEEVVACVVSGLTPAEMAAALPGDLPAWKRPRDWWLVDALPVSDRGKINRRTLAERYLESRLHAAPR